MSDDVNNTELEQEQKEPVTMQMGFNEEGHFIINFGQQVTWMGMTRGQAIDFADAILKHCMSHTRGGQDAVQRVQSTAGKVPPRSGH